MFKSNWIRKPNYKDISFKDYNDYWAHRGWEINRTLKEREKIMLQQIPADSSAIDIGCGNSLLPVKLQEKGCRVDIGDVSPKVLEGYRQHGIEGKIIDLEDITSISFDKQYDYIILSEVLEHLRHPEKTINALKPFTQNFAITIPNTAAIFYRYGLAIKGRFPTQWTYHPSEHLRYWSHIDFLDWLDAMGLHVEKDIGADGVTVRGFLPFLPKMWKNLFAHRVVYICTKK